MTDLESPATGHRNSNAIDEDEFGLRPRLQSLTKKQYWTGVLVLAVALTLVSFVWQKFWLPEKEITWSQWSRFKAQQTVSLKRPLLIWFQPNAEAETESTDWKANLETPTFRQRFHIQSGVALFVPPTTDDSQLSWLFENRPALSSHWICLNGQAPQPFDVSVSETELLKQLKSDHEPANQVNANE